MSKKGKGSGFDNLLAKKFIDPKKIEYFSEEEIYKWFDTDSYKDKSITEFEVLLKQLSDNLNEERGAKYPIYGQMLFHNPSCARYVYEYCKTFKDEIKEDKGKELALRHLIANAFKDSKSAIYPSMDADVREKYLLKAFDLITRARIKDARMLKVNAEDKELKVESSIALAIYTYLDINQISRVAKMFDSSPLSFKKKLRIFRRLYGKKRYYSALGGLFTVEAANDFVGDVYKKFMKMDKKKRKKILFYYATHFKRVKRRTFEISSEEFLKKNKRVIKKLKKEDIGFKKAFKPINSKKDVKFTPAYNNNNFNKNKKRY